jgi:hypothetical protein
LRAPVPFGVAHGNAPAALDAGTIVATPGNTEVTISQAVAPSGGTAPYVRNLYRSTTNGVKGTEIQAAVTLPHVDTGRTNGTPYYYTLEVDDNVAATDDTAQVTATPVASPAFVFESDWSTATGTTDNALNDGGTWGSIGCPGTAAAVGLVLDGAALGWTRTTNVIRMEFNGAGPCIMLEQSDAVTISTTHWGQFWIRNDSVGTKNDHPVAYNNLHFSGDIQAVPFTRHSNNPLGGSHPTEWYTAVVVNGSKCFSPALDNETWYRFEWEMEYVTGTTVKMHPRIYSDAGTLLYTADDYAYAPGGYASLQAAYDGGVTHTIGDAELARDWGMGQEGPGGQPDTGDFFYYGAVRLSETGWIGGAL